jgi:pimeloyl-ACP methyl ester carboxylesterase
MGWWTWLVGVVVAIASGLLLFQLVMFRRFVRYAQHTGRVLERRSAWWRLRALGREAVALWLAGWWHVRDLFADGRRAPVGERRGPPVLCVHGFGENGTNFFALRRALAAQGRLSEVVSLGRPPRAITRYADVLEPRLERLLDDEGGPVDVICHSMGGIVLRILLARRPDLARRLGRVVTVASPHQGTAGARGLGALPEPGFMGRRRGGWPGLPALHALLPVERVATVASRDDLTVYPIETTRVEGARHVEVDGVGHAGLIIHPEGYTVVLATLDALPRPGA